MARVGNQISPQECSQCLNTRISEAQCMKLKPIHRICCGVCGAPVVIFKSLETGRGFIPADFYEEESK